MSVGKAYSPLPSRLTLVSRFWSELPSEEIVNVVQPLFQETQPIALTFGESAKLGPKQVTVHLIENTKGLKNLHAQLLGILNTIGVMFTSPQFVGDGHKPHVSKRDGDQLIAGHMQMANAAYLIEVERHGEGHLRFIRTRFELTA